MSRSELGELYFIAAMMGLILIVSFIAVFFFVKTYRKEMREKEERVRESEAAADAEEERNDAAS